MVVAAAGNDGKDVLGHKIYGQIHSPGNEPSAITVGAANTFGTDARADDGVATYSSRGPTRGYWADASGVQHYDNSIKPDLVAPGNKLISAEAVEQCKLVITTPVARPQHQLGRQRQDDVPERHVDGDAHRGGRGRAAACRPTRS